MAKILVLNETKITVKNCGTQNLGYLAAIL